MCVDCFWMYADCGHVRSFQIVALIFWLRFCLVFVLSQTRLSVNVGEPLTGVTSTQTRMRLKDPHFPLCLLCVSVHERFSFCCDDGDGALMASICLEF